MRSTFCGHFGGDVFPFIPYIYLFVSLSICHEMMGLDAMILVFLMLSREAGHATVCGVTKSRK